MVFIKGGNAALQAANSENEPNSLIIEHIPTGEARLLMASKIKLTGFKDALTTNFNKEAAYGRMDEIPFYQGTTRQIDLSIRLGPYYHYSSNDAKESKYNNNLFAEETLRDIMRFQYPTFIQRAGAGLRTIQSPPLLNIKFGQLIRSNDNGPLICYLNGFTYSPLIDASPFSDKNVYVDGENMIPKQYDVNFSITVLHDYDLGTTVDEPLDPIDPNTFVGPTIPQEVAAARRGPDESLFLEDGGMSSVEEQQANAEDIFDLGGG